MAKSMTRRTSKAPHFTGFLSWATAMVEFLAKAPKAWGMAKVFTKEVGDICSLFKTTFVNSGSTMPSFSRPAHSMRMISPGWSMSTWEW